MTRRLLWRQAALCLRCGEVTTRRRCSCAEPWLATLTEVLEGNGLIRRGDYTIDVLGTLGGRP